MPAMGCTATKRPRRGCLYCVGVAGVGVAQHHGFALKGAVVHGVADGVGNVLVALVAIGHVNLRQQHPLKKSAGIAQAEIVAAPPTSPPSSPSPRERGLGG